MIKSKPSKSHYDNSTINKLIIVFGCLSIFLSYIPYDIPFLAAGMLLASVLFMLLKRVLGIGSFFYYDPSFLILVFLFIVGLFVGLIYTRGYDYGLSKAVTVAIFLIYYLFFAWEIKNDQSFFLLLNFVLLTIYIAIMLLYFGSPTKFISGAMLDNRRLGVNYEGEGNVINPIWLSRHIGYYLISFILLNYRFKYRVVSLILIATSVLYMIASGSKGPLISLIISILFYFMIFKGRLKNLIVLSIVSGILFLIGYELLNIGQNEYLMSRFSLDGGDNNENRLERMSLSFSRGIDHFFTGHGTGDFAVEFSGVDSRDYPHNIFAEIFFENGFLFVCIFSGMLYQAFNGYKKNISHQNAVFFSFFLYFLGNSMVSGDLISNLYLFLFLFVIVSNPVYNFKNNIK